MGLCTPWLRLCTLHGLRTPPWLLLCTLHGLRTLQGFGSAHSMGSAHFPWLLLAHSMGSVHFPWILLCTLRGFRTLPMAFALAIGPVHFHDGFGLHTPWAPNTPIAFIALFQHATLPKSPFHSAIAKFKRPNAMLSRRRAVTVVRANWWDGGRLEHLVGPLALHTYVAPALHTPWGSALHGFGSARSMGSAHFPWLLLCTLHGFRTLPMAFDLHTPWGPYTSHGFCSAHSIGPVHFHHGFCSAHSIGPVHFHHGFGLHTPWAPNTPIAFIASLQDATSPNSPFHSAIAQFKRPNAMLSRRRTTAVGLRELVGRRSA